MARFFFDTSIDESLSSDEQGLEYADFARARHEAHKSLAALVAEALGRGALHCAITVRDATGKVLVRFFADLGEDAGIA